VEDVLIGGLLLASAVGLFAEVVLAAILLSAAAWAVVAVLAIVALCLYAWRLSDAIVRDDWAFVADLLLVPLVAGFLATVLSVSQINLWHMNAVSSPSPAIIAVVVFSVWVAPFLGLYCLLYTERWTRLWAYPLCFMATYVFMYLVINWDAVSAR
jgi:hypothetical protein